MADLPTTYVSETQLTATLDPSTFEVGVQPLTVANSIAVSHPVDFTFNEGPPPPSIALTIPVYGLPDTNSPVSIGGSGYVSGAVVVVDGTPYADPPAAEPAAVVSSSLITAVFNLPAGTHSVMVRNPDGQESNAVNWRSTLPVLEAVTPNTLSVAAGPTGVTATGVGFSTDYLYIGTHPFALSGSHGVGSCSVDPAVIGVGTYDAYISVASGAVTSNVLPFTVTA